MKFLRKEGLSVNENLEKADELKNKFIRILSKIHIR